MADKQKLMKPNSDYEGSHRHIKATMTRVGFISIWFWAFFNYVEVGITKGKVVEFHPKKNRFSSQCTIFTAS